MTVTATDAGAADSFSVMAVKAGGGSQQMHSWSFKGVNVSVKGAKATIKGDLGSYGKVNAKLTAGAKVKGAVPAGCTGTPGSARRGTLKGATKLVLDSTFFRTLAPNSLKGQIVQGAKLDCSGGATGGPTTGLVLTSFADGSDGPLMLNVLKQGPKGVQQVMRTHAPRGDAPGVPLVPAHHGAPPPAAGRA